MCAAQIIHLQTQNLPPEIEKYHNVPLLSPIEGDFFVYVWDNQHLSALDTCPSGKEKYKALQQVVFLSFTLRAWNDRS